MFDKSLRSLVIKGNSLKAVGKVMGSRVVFLIFVNIEDSGMC